MGCRTLISETEKATKCRTREKNESDRREKEKKMANVITGCRIIFSIGLLFAPVPSSMFYGFYLLAGFTDMIDGTVARMTHTDSEFGAKLDTMADVVFVAACMIKLIPVLSMPWWLWGWIGVIVVIKVSTIMIGILGSKKLVAIHSICNKVTGAALFVLPLTLPVVDLKYSGVFMCNIATVAAVQEMYYVGIKKITCVSKEEMDCNG